MMGSAAGRFARSALAIIGAFQATAAMAQVRWFDVSAGPATKSVPEFARQAGVQILASEPAVRNSRTAALRGSMTVADGLERLLRGTGLRGIRLDRNTFTLMAIPARSGVKPKDPAPEDEPAPSTIMVTGFRSSLSLALGLKRRENASVDTILAEDIGKFPDANLAESMQRLPGISLTRGDGGEGRNVTVRGLAADFTRVRINGMEAASQTGSSDAYGGSNNSRSFDFNVFPSELFSSLKVYQTTTARIEEGSLGATIDLQTPHPLDFAEDLLLSATARMSYNGMARRQDPRIWALASKRFAGDSLGVLIAATYGRRHTRDVGYSAVLALPAWVNGGFCSPVGVSPINPDPALNASKGTDTLNCSTANPRTGSLEAWNAIQSRTGPQGEPGGGAFFPRLPRYLSSRQDARRYGATIGAQWAPDGGTIVTLDGVYAGFDVAREDSYISGLSFARSASSNGQPMTSVRAIEMNPAGSVLYGLYDGVDVRSERWIDRFRTQFLQGTLRVDHRLASDLRINAMAGLGWTRLASPHRMWVNIDAIDTKDFAVDFRRNATFPSIHFGFDVADPANFAFGPGLADGTITGTIGDRKLDRTTTNATAALELALDISRGLKLTGGGSWRVSDYRSTILSLDPARQRTPALPPGTALRDVTLQVDGLDKLLGHGAPASWVAVDNIKWMRALGYDRSWFCGVACGAPSGGVREEIGAAFAMLSFDLSSALPIRLRGDVGLRYARTDQSSFGYVPVVAPAGWSYATVGARVEAQHIYGDWLPSANLVADLDSHVLLRLAAARVLARPQLAGLIPGGTIDAVGRRGTITNPKLKPVRANTIDAAIEWYFAPGSLLSAAYFRKNIKTYVQSVNSLVPFDRLGLPRELLASSQTRPDELFVINQLADTPGGRLQGLEINAQAPLKFLPGSLGEFGFLGSLTLVTSRINYILQSAENLPTLTSTDDLVGLSRRALSATLYHEGRRLGGRVTGNYRSGFIRTIPSGAFDSDLIGNRPTFFTDLSITYAVTPKVKIAFEVQNLTNETNVQYIDSVRRDSLFALQSGRTITFGVSLKK